MKGFGKSETLTTLEIPATSTDTAFRLARYFGIFPASPFLATGMGRLDGSDRSG